jgi:mRNA interferase RelE/StbE
LTYEVHIAPPGERAIRKLPAKIQTAVLDRLSELAEEPRPSDCEKLKGMTRQDLYRVKVKTDYRVLYQVKDSTMCVLVVKVADRKEVYRRLDDLKQFLR